MRLQPGQTIVRRVMHWDRRIAAVQSGASHAIWWSWLNAEGDRLAELASRRAAPFDRRWCDFTPDPSWSPAAMPFWWDVPAGRAGIWFSGDPRRDLYS